jgi:hypothetical protein
MEQNVFESLKGLEGEVKATSRSTYTQIEFSGSVKIERGNFSMVICFFARLSETKHKGIVSIDDWDVNDTEDFIFNGLPLDSVTNLKNQIIQWGFESMAKKLDFTNQEQKTAICMAMLESDDLKKMYGENFKVWELLSVDEQRLLDLQFIVENFKGCGEHIKQQVATHYKIGVQPTPTPTLEEFELKLAELTK